MSAIGEGMAELGQGAASAVAVEQGGTGSEANGGANGDDGHTHETACLNCGTALVGAHCHGCGQGAHVHRTLGAFFHDLLHGVFHFEGKVWRTVPLLAWHPGRLTREYIDGRRASYVSPIALFLFSVFVMFAVFHATEGHEAPVGVADRQDRAQAVSRLEGEIAGIAAARKAAIARGEASASFDRQIDALRDSLDNLHDLTANDGGGPVADNGQQIKVDTGVAKLDGAIRKFRSNPDLAAYKLQTYAYKYSWALIPISVPFLWLLFPFSRRFHLYDHTVFVTYSLCFMTLLVIVAMVVGALGASSVAGVLFFLPPLHMYRQLRGAYGLGRSGALWRTGLLVLFAVTALAMFFLMIMAQISL